MKRRATAIACLLFATLALAPATGWPAKALSSDDIAGKEAFLSGAHEQQAFVVGGTVTIDATASDDVYAAGGDILVENANLRDISMAGGWIDFSRSRAEDIQAVGGNIGIDGEIVDDLMAAGFRISLGHRAKIGGDVRLAGAFVSLNGKIRGDVKISAANLRIDGEIDGDLEIMAEEIHISPQAVILGSITYRSPNEADLAPGARVDGPIERQVQADFEAPLGFFGIVGAIILAAMGGLLALILLAAAAQGLVPRLLDAASATVGLRAWSSLGLGFAVLVATPVAALLLFTTLVGVPLGIVLLALYAVALAFAMVIAGYWTGQRVRAIAHGNGPPRGFWNRLSWTGVGLALIALLSAIPFVGGLIGLLALIAGLGAFVLQAWPRAVETG
jgi:cytoskeletal protein CcmA (bactofilin family)